jgi:hypothetical protein
MPLCKAFNGIFAAQHQDLFVVPLSAMFKNA